MLNFEELCCFCCRLHYFSMNLIFFMVKIQFVVGYHKLNTLCLKPYNKLLYVWTQVKILVSPLRWILLVMFISMSISPPLLGHPFCPGSWLKNKVIETGFVELNYTE